MRNARIAGASSLFLLLVCAGCDAGDTGTGGASSTGHATSASVGGAGGGGAGGDGPIDARFQPLADAVEKDLAAYDAPGAAVAVIEGGKVTFAHGFGLKQKGGTDPVDARTLFRIGSCNKMLTTAALLGEVAKGGVDLSDALTDELPEVHFADPAWAPSIAIEHLLTHSSSMSDYLEVDTPASQHTDAALHDFLTGNGFRTHDYLMAKSGAFFNYSNPNFYFAGLLAETSAGAPYRDVVKSHVFDPLGMDRTFFLASDILADGNYALGETMGQGIDDPVMPDTYENAWGRPAGYATSNVYDMAKFVGFLRDGNTAVMPDELRQSMMTAKIDTVSYGDLISYGYGLFVDQGFFIDGQDFHRIPMIEHGGDIPGFAADVYWVPSLDLGLVVLANADGAHLSGVFDAALKTLVALPAPDAPPDVTPDTTKFPLYAGNYQDDYNVGAVTVSLVDGDLEISMPDVDQAGIAYAKKLKRYARETFILTIQGTQVPLSFLDDEAGDVHYMRTRFFVAAKEDAAQKAAARALPAYPASSAERASRIARALSTFRRERHGLSPAPSNLAR